MNTLQKRLNDFVAYPTIVYKETSRDMPLHSVVQACHSYASRIDTHVYIHAYACM